MKILLVCKSLPHSFLGGIQTHVWKLSEWLIHAGHDVSILTAGSYKNGLRHRELNGRKLVEIPYLPGRKLPFFPILAEEMAFNITARKWLLKNQSNYDVIHLQGRSGNLFLKDKKLVKTPVVNTLHGLVGVENGKAGNHHRWTLDRRLHKVFCHAMEHHALQNADKLIAVSQEMAAEIHERDAACLNKTQVVYNGVDLPRVNLDIATDPNLLLFVGRLTPIKGVFELVEAMKNVPERVHLLMVGDGESRPKLEQLIKHLRLGEKITLTGALDSEGVFERMRRCHALVLPSYHETQGIVLLEANAFGKPVIASAVGGVKEVVENGKNGLLMPSNDPKHISAAIQKIFGMPEAAHQMGEYGRSQTVPKFLWKNIATETINIYESLCKQNFTEWALAPAQQRTGQKTNYRTTNIYLQNQLANG